MRILPVLFITVLTGCSLLPDKTLEYRQAEVLPRMTLPEGMVSLSGDDMFAVPDAERRLAYDKDDRFEVPKPPEFSVVAEQQPAPDAPLPDAGSTRIVLTKDGNDYPIIMIYTAFPWAWEYVSKALGETDLRVDDRSREAGIFFVKVPKSYGLAEREAQIKLSHTVNGVQVAVLNSRGSALVEAEPGLAILQRLHEKL
ncbi:outer membrane protein assembly factor BamC [Alcanivorax sp. 1008]|uniref:outer membrane protein assembly factor BamC n=1 Tax=Alcanivorax sp. 1008 TaxID=2816853 RepID=UPI001DA781AA|nr:outer membrane protein assembly factor BamC [Alcanivorax sp. 1008]MCC1496466.1 outer membrane protein assembly factor BamC [Alcanivorax sp. 1008]